eukprot:151703_1
MSSTDRPFSKTNTMMRSNSSTLDTTRLKSRTLFPRLPSASNLSIHPRNEAELTSRTREACRRTGVDPLQILPIDYDKRKKKLFDANSSRNKNVPESVLELRRTFAEKERLTLLKEVDFTRTNLIENGWNPENSNVSETDKINIRAKTPKIRVKLPYKKLSKEYAKNEIYRNKTARRKTLKINSLLSQKWQNEASRVQKIKQLKNANSLIGANQRHKEYIQSIVQKTKQTNSLNQQKSIKAQESIEKELQNK